MIIIIVNIDSGVYYSTGVYFAVWLLVGIFGAIVSFYLWHVGIILTGAYGMYDIFNLALVFMHQGCVTSFRVFITNKKKQRLLLYSVCCRGIGLCWWL